MPGQPGLVTEEQLEGWTKVTSAVHEGGRIFAQAMHAGQVTHPATNGGQPAHRRVRWIAAGRLSRPAIRPQRDPRAGPPPDLEVCLQ